MQNPTSQTSRSISDFTHKRALQFLVGVFTQPGSLSASRLLNGWSRVGETHLQKAEAEELARGCILCAEQLYRVIFDAFDPKSTEELEVAMKKYEAEALQWCIEKARQRH